MRSRRLSLEHKALAFAVLFVAVFMCALVSAGSAYDFTQPVLSEQNPNGTIDYWYLGSGAEK